MITIKLADYLLRRAGLRIEYRVQRRHTDDMVRNTDGTTIAKTITLKHALERLRNCRVADTDIVSVRLVAIIDQRKGESA